MATAESVQNRFQKEEIVVVFLWCDGCVQHRLVFVCIARCMGGAGSGCEVWAARAPAAAGRDSSVFLCARRDPPGTQECACQATHLTSPFVQIQQSHQPANPAQPQPGGRLENSQTRTSSSQACASFFLSSLHRQTHVFSSSSILDGRWRRDMCDRGQR